MKTTLQFLVLISATLFLTACPAEGESGANAPESPEKLVIHWNKSGGMLPVSERIYISKDSAKWEWWHFQAETIVQWKPTEQEIDELYATLVDNKFHQIKSKSKGMVYDRGGVSINITVDDDQYKIDNSGNSFIQEKDQKAFGNISSTIKKYTFDQINAQLLSKPLNISEDFNTLPYTLVLKINDEILIDPLDIQQKESSLPVINQKVEFYPSENRFQTYLYYVDSTNRYGNPALYKSLDYIERIDTSVTEVRLELGENNFPYIEINR